MVNEAWKKNDRVSTEEKQLDLIRKRVAQIQAEDLNNRKAKWEKVDPELQKTILALLERDKREIESEENEEENS